MLKKFLKEAMVLIAGKSAEDLVELLDTNKHVNEFAIAKKLNLTINQTRNILYKISDYGLVSSIRKKDKRKGWYTYFWKIEVFKSLEFIRSDLTKKMDNFEHQIKSRETKRFYVCEKCHIELNEEHALLNNFTCNECGELLAIKDNTKIINEMKRNLERLRKDLGFVQEEIRKESGVLDKKRQKEMKKERKEILEKKIAQKAKNAKARALLKSSFHKKNSHDKPIHKHVHKNFKKKSNVAKKKKFPKKRK